MTKEFIGDDEGNVKALITVDVEVGPDGIKPVAESEREWPVSVGSVFARARHTPHTPPHTSASVT